MILTGNCKLRGWCGYTVCIVSECQKLHPTKISFKIKNNSILIQV